MLRPIWIATLLLGVPAAAHAEIVMHDGLGFARQVVPDTTFIEARASSRIVYLNRNGVTLTPGVNDSRLNRSSLVAEALAVPPWNASSTLWSDTVTCLQDMFAPFDLEITETDPGELPHIEAVFGGTPSMLGMPASVAGIAPFSSMCNVIENSIVLTFADAIPQTAKAACEVMAHEIGHSYGLDHEMLAADPMTYFSYAGNRTFQDVDAACGETVDRPCGAPELPSCRPTQNSYALLMERLGVHGTGDVDPPVVAITAPADNARVAPGFAIFATAVDDIAVTSVTFYVDNVEIAMLTEPPFTVRAPATLAPGSHQVALEASDGVNLRRVVVTVTVPEPPEPGTPDEDDPAGGCATSGGSSLFTGLALLGLISAIQRRAQR